jgi:class 3 adenylate cyclase/tetratricopeptide (TPR) repeat protein
MAKSWRCRCLAPEHPVICPSCGFAYAQAARFCAGCGNRLEAAADAAPEAERRQICVLFCDLVGSTPLSQTLDPEDLRGVLGSYRHACEAVVLRHGGFVAQYYGDGVEVYFGYPSAREDDASRVVRCALDMLEAIRQLAKATKLDLRVRIAIDSGRVVVGRLGSSGHTAIGDTPNIAARAQAEAAPGEVVVTDSLRRLLPETIPVESMGSRTLKGVERPVELFKIVGSGGQTTPVAMSRTPFVGRANQRERIREIWGRAMSGLPQFVLLRGEPGIGKSRLVDVVRHEIASDRADVLVARCTSVTTDTAFHPIAELIGSRLGFEGATADERVTRLANRMSELGIAPGDGVPLLASILSIPVDPAQWPMPALSSQRARQRTMDILIAWTLALTQRGSVLLVLEDLHWADPSTVELLRQLIASLRSAGLMTLLTARPEFAPTWARATNVTEVELGALDLAESEIFIRKVAHDKPLPPDVVWKIRERGAGNPLFLEEITRSILESGALAERERAWELVGTVSSEVVPASMDASLMARIDRLGKARALFQIAATLGREFTYDLLAAVAETPDDAVRESLDVILQSGLVYQDDEKSGLYTFKHTLIRDAAYDSLLRATRQRYHARIAKVLITRFPQIVQNRPELLAHHLSGGGSHADAAAYWRAAGKSAAERSAVNEAVSHFRRAIADLDRLPMDAARMDQELSALTALAPALMAAHGWAASQVGETCKRAIDLAGRLGAPGKMWGPLRGLWTHELVGGRLQEAMETATQLMAIGLASGDPILVSTGRNATCSTHYYRGEYNEAIAEAQAGLSGCSYDIDVAIARALQTSAAVNMRMARGGALWMQGRQQEGVAIVEDMVAYARSLRHPPSIATALASAMGFSDWDRDWPRAFAFADEVYNLSRAEGFAMWVAAAGMYRGRARIGLGQVDDGVAEVLEWAALFRQTGFRVIEGSTTSMISESLHLAGRSEEALEVSGEGERRAKKGFVRLLMPEVHRIKGNILRDLGRSDDSDVAYCRAAACAREQGAVSLELRALTSLLELRLSGGQPGPLPAKLRRAMSAMACAPDRPDLVAARELLSRVRD